MPNHIYNKLTIKASKKITEEIKKFVKENGEEKSLFCADSILKMPPELKGVTYPTRIVSQNEYDLERVSQGNKNDLFQTYSITQEMSDEYKKKYGCDNWYDWTNENWGTKWGAYDVDSKWVGNHISFTTAWSPPIPLIEVLSKKFPEAKLTLKFQEECNGFNGTMVFQNGNIQNGSECSPSLKA